MDKVWEDFEPPTGTVAQYLLGEIRVLANPVLLHDLIGRDIEHQLYQGPVEAWRERGIDLSPDGKPRPDVAFLDPERIDAEWRDVPASVLLGVAEVVSPSSAAMDYRDKTKAYARHKIAVYLIADPRDGTWTVMELVESADGPMYIAKTKGRFGDPIDLKLGGTPVQVETAAWHQYPEHS
ncbi:hypothetical protein BIV57_15895 [Mangrovactinospora gilvigrisea]|uniref:Putative restriction endonuclease domain-containing protein n=1 Tax=Mangrovactinospora gilvigrisea TaxID=1428644 RepID=A0A1J7BCU6_9ACTN|nr:Uma2 family endonuclease [Mangrovactinospora gilvigrisea]OIV36507.1 hypothetical protein BIV57_15895 [Mangrovactinospora gilvigrisea]